MKENIKQTDKQKAEFLNGFEGETLENVIDYWATLNCRMLELTPPILTVVENKAINKAIATIKRELSRNKEEIIKDVQYLNIKNGKIYNKETAISCIEGILKGIELRDRIFRGEKVEYWYINIEDDVIYSLALPYSSGVAKSIFNSLASGDNFSKEIKIQTYQSGEFTKALVYLNGLKLKWKVNELPAVEELIVGSKIIKDDSKRMEFIKDLVTEINNKL